MSSVQIHNNLVKFTPPRWGCAGPPFRRPLTKALSFWDWFMRCPHCHGKVSLADSIKVSRWSNYECKLCGSRSNRTMVNGLVVYTSAIVLTYLIEYLMRSIDIASGIWVHLVLLVVFVVSAEIAVGKLVPVDET